jgi:peptide/nickel transport system substrate-binding protein
LRLNPRKSWWNNVAEIATNGTTEATFVLKRPQPAILALIASGYTPIYPCHVPPRDMRQHPIGTGAFKFVEFKPNESIKLVRNPDYWKPGRPFSMASNTPSSRTARPRYSRLSPAISI